MGNNRNRLKGNFAKDILKEFNEMYYPIPKQVEIERAAADSYSYDSVNDFSTYKPKVDANNFINVIRWIYE